MLLLLLEKCCFFILFYLIFSYPIRQICKSHSSLSTSKSKFFWEELEKVVSKWPFQVYLERKLESRWSWESRFGFSKHQSRLSFYLYVLIYSETWSIYSRKCSYDWCINFQKWVNFSATRSCKQWNDCVETKGSLYIWSKESKYLESVAQISNIHQLTPGCHKMWTYSWAFLEIRRITLMPFLNERWNQIKPWFL